MRGRRRPPKSRLSLNPRGPHSLGAYPRGLAAKEEAGRSEESNSMSGFLE